MINKLKYSKLNDDIVDEFIKTFNSGLYFHYHNDIILWFNYQSYSTEFESDYLNKGSFNGDFNHISDNDLYGQYIEDPNLLKITDKTGQHVLWERTPEEPVDPKRDSTERINQLIQKGIIKPSSITA